MALNLGSLLEYTARRHPDATAQILEGQHWTFRDLHQQAGCLSNALCGLGLGRGDRVALMMPNLPEFTVAYFGILYSGATVVPLNFLSVEDEIAYFLEDSQSRAFIAHRMYGPAALAAAQRIDDEPAVILGGRGEPAGEAHTLEGLIEKGASSFDMAQTMPDDTAVILYTSGTTGRSKGAELTHFNMYSNAQWCAERSQSNPPVQMRFFGPGNVAIVALPLFHSFGQTCIQNSMLFHGAAISYMPRWDPEHALRIIERDSVTVFAGVPTMYFGLLHAGNFAQVKRDSLTYCYSGGAPMPVEVMNEFDDKFKVNIMEGYGLSETSPVATFHTPERPRKVGSVGFPIFGCEVRIFNDQDEELAVETDGEVVIRGQNIMKSYYRRPEATAETMRGGWFHTGDIGRMDEDGYLYIVDRKKDMIIRGGFNVYPRELEEILYAHPAVQECAVIGVTDAEHGEEIKAVIALRQGVRISEEELRAYCKDKMAAYKYPRLFEFRPELPKGPTGKILKRELK